MAHIKCTRGSRGCQCKRCVRYRNHRYRTGPRGNYEAARFLIMAALIAFFLPFWLGWKISVLGFKALTWLFSDYGLVVAARRYQNQN